MHKDSNRPRRVAELLKRELAMIIPRELDDSLAHRITLTHVEVLPDYSVAKVFFTVLGGADAPRAATQALKRAAGFLRHALAGRVVLRGIPALRFYYDESVERGARLTSLIERAIAEDKTHPKD